MSELFLENLRDAVRVAGKDTEVIIDSRPEGVFVGAHNHSHSVSFSSEEANWEQFFAAIPQPTANQLARTLVADKLKLVVKENVLIAKSKGVNLKVPLTQTNTTLAKLVRKYEKNALCTVTNLSQGINLVKFAANDKTIGDVVLQGYHLTLRGDHAEIMASNGAVLAVTTIPATGMGDEEEVLLLNPDFNQLVPFLEGDVTLGVKDGTLSLTRETETGRTLRMVSALTQGTAFNYSAVLDTSDNNKTLFTLPTNDSKDALRGLSYFTDEQNHNRVSLSLHKSTALLEAVNANGQANTEIEVTEGLGVPDGGIQLVTSFDNLTGFINTTKSPEFGLKVKDGRTPIFMTDSDDENEYYTLKVMSVVFS